MPHLQSLSIRLRGNRTDKTTTSSSNASSTGSHTLKHFFFGRDHRERKSDTKSTKSDKARSSTDKMGNAPSDMNGRSDSPRQRGGPAAQLLRSVTDAESIRSARAMPGAEPPTPTPAPAESVPDLEPWRSPSPNADERVQSYDTQDVPHVQNPLKVEEEQDIGTGAMPFVTSFEAPQQLAAEEEKRPAEDEAHGQALSALQIPEHRADPDSVTTPRPAVVKPTEASLSPVKEETEHGSPPGLEQSPSRHISEPTDATAVSSGPDAGTPPGGAWTPGTYVLLNARSGTAVDMSGMDNKTLIGYPMHGGPNQQWEFIPAGPGYVIRCVRRSKDGQSLYLTTEDGLRPNAAIVASPYPVSWNVDATAEGIRISWPNTDLVFDLADWGSNSPGTKIQLMPLKPGEPCQLWHYTRCAPAEHDKEVEVRSSRAVSPPATTETVSVTEERDYITTTRATTTTTITTVTEVTKMPRWMLAQARPQSPNRRSIGYRLA